MFFLCSLFRSCHALSGVSCQQRAQENLQQPRIWLGAARCIQDPLNPAPGGSNDQGASPRMRRPVLVCVRSMRREAAPPQPTRAPPPPLARHTVVREKSAKARIGSGGRSLYPGPAQPRTGRFKRSGRLTPQEAPCSCLRPLDEMRGCAGPTRAPPPPLARDTGGPPKISEGENRIRRRALYPRPAYPRTGGSSDQGASPR